jgi:hypothetical protein
MKKKGDNLIRKSFTIIYLWWAGHLVRLQGVGLLYRVGGQTQPTDLLLLLADDVHRLEEV